MAASESDNESHEADVTVSRRWQESNSILPVAVMRSQIAFEGAVTHVGAHVGYIKWVFRQHVSGRGCPRVHALSHPLV